MPTEPEVPPQPVWITGNWASEYERPDAIAYVPASVADTYRNERNEILTEIVVRSGKSMDLDFNGDLVGQARVALEALVPVGDLAKVWERCAEVVETEVPVSNEFAPVLPFVKAIVKYFRKQRDAALSAGQKEI